MSLVLFVLAGLAAAMAAYALWQTRHINKRWPPLGLFVDSLGSKAHVVVQGQGPDVLLLHGAASNARELLSAFDGRLDQVRKIAPDRPGLGHSHRSAGAEQLAVQAAFIAGILEKTAKEPVVAVGHSWGAAVCLRLALDRPDLVKALVLLAPASHPWTGGTSLTNRLAAMPVIGPILCWALPPLLGPLLAPAGIARGFAPGPVSPAAYGAMIGTPLVFRPHSFAANAQDMHVGSVELAHQAPRYSSLNIPVSIVSGQGDKIVYNTIHAGGLMRDIPQARSYRVAQAGHMPHWVDPGLAEAIILAHAFDSEEPQASRFGAQIPAAG
jgi:pimeloyl-ACP methyl ester carboxylesterase